MAYSNGQIPDSALVTIDRGARLLPGPAKSFTWICDEVERRYGWRPRPTGSFDGYRPLSGNYYAQTETFLRRYTRQALGSGRYGDVRFWNGVRYVRTNGAAAAVPGKSNHGWACAADVADLLSFTSERYRQFAEVAAEAGWSNDEGRSIGEYWHWVDPSSVALVKAGQSTTGTIPSIPDLIAPDPIEEDPLSSAEAIARLDQLIAKTDTTTEIIGIPIAANADRTKGQHFYLVNWPNGTKLHLNSTALAYHKARGQLDIVEWQPPSTLAGLVTIK